MVKLRNVYKRMLYINLRSVMVNQEDCRVHWKP